MFGNTQRNAMGKVFRDASAEAQRMGDRRIGTEHMTLAMLADPESATAKALGVSLTQARETLQSLDFAALAAVGIDAVDPGPALPARERVRLTPGVRDVLVSAHKEKPRKPLAARHILIGLLGRKSPDPAAELLDALGVNRAEVHARLLAS
jgi:ATP-dependent Clp protease ATP-binding subunit ClpA